MHRIRDDKALYMTDRYFVDLVTGLRVGLFCVEYLLDGERSHGISPIIALPS